MCDSLLTDPPSPASCPSWSLDTTAAHPPQPPFDWEVTGATTTTGPVPVPLAELPGPSSASPNSLKDDALRLELQAMQSLGTEYAVRHATDRDPDIEIVPFLDRLKDALAKGYIDQVSNT